MKTNEKKCRYCGFNIRKVRVSERIGGRIWRWAITEKGGFYCPKAGGDCWHEPEGSN